MGCNGLVTLARGEGTLMFEENLHSPCEEGLSLTSRITNPAGAILSPLGSSSTASLMLIEDLQFPGCIYCQPVPG
jgi:hypothetical protein